MEFSSIHHSLVARRFLRVHRLIVDVHTRIKEIGNAAPIELVFKQKAIKTFLQRIYFSVERFDHIEQMAPRLFKKAEFHFELIERVYLEENRSNRIQQHHKTKYIAKLVYLIHIFRGDRPFSRALKRQLYLESNKQF